MPYDAGQLARLLVEIRRPYLSATTPERPGRDKLWDDRRDILHRRARPWLPEKYQVFAKDILYRDPLPGFVVNYLTHRLGSNDVQYAVWLPGDPGPKLTAKGQQLENWIRGTDYELDPLGFKDQRVRRHQAGDGLGVFELDFGRSYIPAPPKQGVDYLKQIDEERRTFGMSCRLGAPDPRSLYMPTGQTQPDIVVKVVNKQLVDVQNQWVSQGWRLSYQENEGKKLTVSSFSIVGGEMPPGPAPLDVGRWVRCVVIAMKDRIYHCIYPDALAGPTTLAPDDSPGSPPQLILVGEYPNPLGRPPFYFAPARTTEDPDPAFMYEPLACELIDMTPYINEMMTVRNIAALREGLKPVHFKPGTPQTGQDSTAPDDANALLEPGVWEKYGDFHDIPNPSMQDLDRYTADLRGIYNQFNTSIMGGAHAGQVGKTTAPWAIFERKEEETGLLKEALNSRAAAKREIMLDVIKLMRVKHAKDGPVYVTARAASKKRPEAGHIDLQVGMSATDFDIDFRLEVTIDALSQSQRAAETEYGRRLVGEGSISKQTYEEDFAGVEDRLTELARKRREALERFGEGMALNTAQEIFKAQIRSIFGPIGEIVAGPPTNLPTPPKDDAAPTPQPAEQGDELPTQANDSLPYPSMPGLGQGITLPAMASREGTLPDGAQGGA